MISAPLRPFHAPAGEPGADPYCARARPPAETVAAVRPHFAALGITRLARQTGLDRIGIPVWCAVRPNARTLSVNQGKGADDAAARASAVMEAAEYALAERPDAPVTRASPAALAAIGRAVLPLSRYLPRGIALAADEPIDWVAGEDLIAGGEILAPLSLVTLDHTLDEPSGFARSTNGLASGNNREEAMLHGLCELVERDASTLFSFRSDAAVLAARLDSAALADPVLDALGERIAAAGCDLRLYDMTTDIGIPCFLATIADRSPAPRRHFDLSSGSGCHPVAARAAIRAVTEAAQTRVTSIAGARDDFDPSLYAAPLKRDLAIYLRDGPICGSSPGSRGLPLGAPLARSLAFTRERLAASGVHTVAAVPLGGASYGIAVMRVLAPGLEDAPANRHWRPGGRALRAMIGLA